MFSDACKSKVCPQGANCINIPSIGTKCKCERRSHVMVNNKCVTFKVKTFKVSKLKFEEKFEPEMADTNSVTFKAKAAELEEALYTAVCKRIFGCVDIKVVLILPGSIVVDYNVIIDAEVKNVTVSDVQKVAIEALDDPALAIFKPNRTSIPQAQGMFHLKQRLYLIH